MYDDDRQTALAMYGRMFDETADEAGLMELLVSPTRQAVVLARSYDAKARKLQMEQSESADFSDPDSVPAFIFIIDKTAQQALELGVKETNPVEGQFSIFDELPELEEIIPAAEVETEETVETEEEAPAEAEPITEPAAIPVPLPELHEEAEAQEETEEAERSDVDDTADAVDAFLKDFTIENGELISVKAEPPVEEAPAEAEPVVEVAEAVEALEPEKPAQKQLKTNILLLVLYIFLAIPLGLVGVALLLIPTVFFLALGSCCGYVGVYAITTSFASFAVIADTMAVFGAGLALVALALFFVWLFVWFLGGAIVGYIRGLCVLGRKLCCKEVEQQ